MVKNKMEVSVFFALLYIPWLQGVLSADIKNNLKYFEVIHAKSFGHNIVKRGIHPSDHPFNKIREVNFKVRNISFTSVNCTLCCSPHTATNSENPSDHPFNII